MDTPRLKVHEVKCWPEFFSAHMTAHKNFEIRSTRLSDTERRDFQVGDLLVIHEFLPCPKCGGRGRVPASYGTVADCECLETENPRGHYTGRSLKRLITYITDFGQREDMVVIALKEWRDTSASTTECPSPERVVALAEHVASLGGYTQAKEIEALGAELQKLRESREWLLQQVERLKATEQATYRAAEREYHRLRDLLRRVRARMTALTGRDGLAQEVDEEISREPIKGYPAPAPTMSGMTVCGVQIELAQIDACLERMRSGEPFSLLELEGVAKRAGVPNQVGDAHKHLYPAHRLADRLIQRERKAGNILRRRLNDRRGVWWVWVGPN